MNEAVQIDNLIEKPFWVIDVLPKQVPAHAAGQFFAVERHWLGEPRRQELLRRKLSVLLKLNCFFDLAVSADADESWTVNPEPSVLEGMIGGYLLALLPAEQALITSNVDDINMTLYNPGAELFELVSQLAKAEGLFVWQPPQE